MYVISLLMSFSSIYAHEVWTRAANFGVIGRGYGVGFTIRDKGYNGTGNVYWGFETWYIDFWEFYAKKILGFKNLVLVVMRGYRRCV